MLPFTFCRTVRVGCPVFIWRYTMKEEKIKVLALLPMELPKEIELDNTLEAMQEFVGGLIECITLSDTGSEVTLVCNDKASCLACRSIVRCGMEPMFLPGRDFWPDATAKEI